MPEDTSALHAKACKAYTTYATQSGIDRVWDELPTWEHVIWRDVVRSVLEEPFAWQDMLDEAGRAAGIQGNESEAA